MIYSSPHWLLGSYFPVLGLKIHVITSSQGLQHLLGSRCHCQHCLCEHTRSKSHFLLCVPSSSTSHIHARNRCLLSYRLNVGHLCALKSPCLAVLQVC